MLRSCGCNYHPLLIHKNRAGSPRSNIDSQKCGGYCGASSNGLVLSVINEWSLRRLKVLTTSTEPFVTDFEADLEFPPTGQGTPYLVRNL